MCTIVLGILLSNPCFVYGRNDFSPETLTAAQADWSYLGKITYYYEEGGHYYYRNNAELYVKVISGKTFYQVRFYSEEYTVVKGSYQHGGKYYNAKFGNGNYFNLP